MNVRTDNAMTVMMCVLAAAAVFVVGCRKVGTSSGRDTAPPIVKTKGGAEMVHVPAGSFMMGSEDGQDDEKPVRKVSVDSFLIDRHEVTQAQYDKLIPEGNAAHFKAPDRPVEQISWVRAAFYCNARSRAEGLEPCYDEETGKCDFQADGYRLPTEAEWEYACRAGTSTAYSYGDNAAKLADHAWHTDNAAKTTHPVGKKKPNPWGLYDMHGNVAEWCNDPYDKTYYKTGPAENPPGPAEGEKYVLRGGAWNASAKACRSSYRVAEAPGNYDGCFGGDYIGFRCVRRAGGATSEPAKTSK